MRLYIVKAKAIGRGRFPLDMLRYDSCYPSGEKESCEMGYDEECLDLKAVRSIRVEKYATSLNREHWSIGRWRSFGWELVEIEVVKIGGGR